MLARPNNFKFICTSNLYVYVELYIYSFICQFLKLKKEKNQSTKIVNVQHTQDSQEFSKQMETNLSQEWKGCIGKNCDEPCFPKMSTQS